MHYSSKKIAEAFFKTYWPENKRGTVVDIGAVPFNGSLREAVPEGCEYIAVDIESHPSIDIVMEDPNVIPMPSQTADIVVCSSVFEHSNTFWVLFLECIRLLKPSGLLYINAPSNGFVHRYPIDAWRFYPDAARALADWAESQNVDVSLLESFIGCQHPIAGEEGSWNDFVAVFTAAADIDAHPRRILHDHPHLQYAPPDQSASQYKSQDQAISSELRSQLRSAEREIEALQEEKETLKTNIFDLTTLIDSQRQNQDRERASWEHQQLAIYQSYSWRITKPLRYLMAALLTVRSRSSITLMRLWLALPLTQAQRDQLKQVIFPIAFWGPLQKTRVFRDWIAYKEFNEANVAPARDIEYPPTLQNVPDWTWTQVAGSENQMMATIDGPSLPLSPDRPMCVALYLPQFHQIPENDKWWGEGFTEWTNTRGAKPLFAGHNQPKIPHPDLGYYDLTDPGVIENQAELAKLYGITAFCMYFYWFGGQRLLEKPLLIYRDSDTIDFPYFLCWANENWTRAWDGRETDVLIAQSHSDNDDRSFIEYVATYFNDPKYLRLGGRPVLMVYKPQLLPNPDHTVELWRTYCRANGIGEVVLLFATERDAVGKDFACFDKGVRFLPNNAGLSAVQNAPDGWKGHSASGALWDWNDLAKKYGSGWGRVDASLCETVSVGWDNSPRRGARGNIFLGDTPAAYEIWLANALKRAQLRNSGIPLVFINAWNEWAEGAVLEPTSHRGYAYLQATRNAVANAARDGDITEVCVTSDLSAEISKYDRAVILHAYYLPEALELLNQVAECLDRLPVLITTPAGNEDALKKHLKALSLEFGLFRTRNKGRDVLPFINLFRSTGFYGAKHILKLHTKKSPHRSDGDQWSASLSAPLIRAFGNTHAHLTSHPFNLTTPLEFLAPLSYYLASNIAHLESLADAVGVDLQSKNLRKVTFPAGTMFICKIEIVRRLASLDLGAEHFEAEAGQIDGTMAHAVERFFGLLAQEMSKPAGCTPLEKLLGVNDESATAFTYAERTNAIYPRPND